MQLFSLRRLESFWTIIYLWASSLRSVSSNFSSEVKSKRSQKYLL